MKRATRVPGAAACTNTREGISKTMTLRRPIMWCPKCYKKAGRTDTCDSCKERYVAWSPRPRPRAAKEPSLCFRYTPEKGCSFGETCTGAHGPAELANWLKSEPESSSDDDDYDYDYDDDYVESWDDLDGHKGKFTWIELSF